MTSRRGCALGLCARWWIAVATEALKSGALCGAPRGGFAPGETTADPRTGGVGPRMEIPGLPTSRTNTHRKRGS